MLIEKNDADLFVMRGLIFWSMFEPVKGFKEFWLAYKVDPKNEEVLLFMEVITPKV